MSDHTPSLSSENPLYHLCKHEKDLATLEERDRSLDKTIGELKDGQNRTYETLEKFHDKLSGDIGQLSNAVYEMVNGLAKLDLTNAELGRVSRDIASLNKRHSSLAVALENVRGFMTTTERELSDRLTTMDLECRKRNYDLEKQITDVANTPAKQAYQGFTRIKVALLSSAATALALLLLNKVLSL